jgi:hypothetical protein
MQTIIIEPSCHAFIQEDPNNNVKEPTINTRRPTQKELNE